MKNKIIYGLMLFMLLFVPKVNACELTYDEFTATGIQQAYVVGDYVFNTDDGYSPSLEDFATAARSIPKGKDVYIYHLLNIDMGGDRFFRVTEMFSEKSNVGKQFFPKINVTYEYWNNINGATEEDYDMFFCKVGQEKIGINYTTLETEGENEYKISATRTVKIDSTADIEKVQYCVTSANECTPDTDAKLSSNNTIKVKYDTNVGGQRICTKATDVYGNYTGIICDDTLVYVDAASALVTPTENLGTTIEKTPSPIDGLFDIEYPISGGEVIYYYYKTENGVENKFLLTDMADLPEGNIKVEVKVVAGNGLVTTASRIIEVKRHTVTYDYQTNGGTSSQIEIYTTAYRGKAKLTPTAYKQNYEFLGWNTDPNATDGIDSLVVEGDVTLYAIFKGELTAKFEVATKDGSIPATIEYDKTSCVVYNNETSCEINIPVLNSKVGYDALGWSTSKFAKTTQYNGGETIEITDNNFKLYSVTRDKIGKTVTFNSYRDEKIVEDVLKCYPYNGETSCTVDASNITSEPYKGKRFIGYTESKENPTPGTVSELTSGKEFYAYYEDVYEINYVTGEGVKTQDTTGVIFIIDSTGVEEYVTETTIKEPELMSGWIFLGYRTDDKLGNVEANPGDKISPNKDITYYAMYERPVEIYYDLEDEVSTRPKDHVGKKHYLSANQSEIGYKYKLATVEEIARDQYIFRGWLISGTEYSAGTEITITEDTYITATWALNGCYIFFDYQTNGGTSATKSSQTYINGDPEIDLSKITAYKTGWTFIGWSDKEGATSNPLSTYRPTTTDEDVTLYAMFKKNIIIDYRVQDATNFTIGSQDRVQYEIFNKAESALVKLPEITTNNQVYETIGWNTDSKATEAQYLSGEEVEISASYTVLYTITKSNTTLEGTFHYIDAQKNQTTAKTNCYLYNASTSCTIKPPELDVSFEGNVLTGWSASKTLVDTNVNYTINKNSEYYGYYDKLIKVTYRSGIMEASTKIQTLSQQTIVSPSGVQVNKPTAILEAPDGIAGYATLGWRKDNKAQDAEYTAGTKLTLDGSIDLYGVYNKNISISYAANRGDSQPKGETRTMFYNTVQDTERITEKFVLADAITRSGFTFLGWMAEGATTPNQPGDTVELNKSTKFTAVWRGNQYKLTYNFTENGGTSSTQNTANVDYDSEVDLTPTAYKEGYEFVGWSDSKNSTTIIDTLVMPDADTTIYAVFRKAINGTWVVTDEASGEVDEEKTLCYKYNNNDTCELSTPKFLANEGYEITGWTTQQGETDVEISDSAKVTVSEDETYYSITRGTEGYVGTFYYADSIVDEETGESTDEVEFVKTEVTCDLYNGKTSCEINQPVQPQDYEGAVFIAWTHEIDEVTEVSMELTEDKTYYAHYESLIGVNLYEGKVEEQVPEDGEIGDTGEGEEGGNAGEGEEGGNAGEGEEGGNAGEGEEGGNAGEGEEGGNTGDGEEGGNTGDGEEGGNTGDGEEEPEEPEEPRTEYIVSEILTGTVSYTIDGTNDHREIPKIQLRKPVDYEDFTPIGWTTNAETLQSQTDYNGDEELTLDESIDLYGLYERTLSLSYETFLDEKIDPIEHKQIYHSLLGPTVHTAVVAEPLETDGATFIKWAKGSVDGEEVPSGTVLVMDDQIKLYADWDGNKYKIKYELNGGKVENELKTDVEYLEVIELEEPTRLVKITGVDNGTYADFTEVTTVETPFKGWELEGNFNSAKYALTEGELIRWENNTIKPKALWVQNLQKAEGSEATLKALYEETTVKLPAISREDFECSWNTKEDGTGIKYESEADYTIEPNASTEIKIYAICKGEEYEVTLDPDGGVLDEADKKVTVTYGLNYRLPTPTKQYYMFKGWLDEDDNLITNNTVVSIRANHSLKAVWEVKKAELKATVADQKYGTVTVPSGLQNSGSEVTVKAKAKNGYVFAGWYDGSSMMSSDEEYTFIMPEENLTLEAKFSLDITKITDIDVLNVYPQKGNNLKTWMETNGYGQGKMNVTPVELKQFVEKPEDYLGTSGNWKYDIIVFGFYDANGEYDLDEDSADLVEEYILDGNPVLFGHDTIANISIEDGAPITSDVTHPYFNQLAKYVDLTLNTSYNSHASTKVEIIKESLFTQYPHSIGDAGTVLTIPDSHVLGQRVGDQNNIFIKFNNIPYSDDLNFYLTVYENCAMIQTGHSNGTATQDEQKILANTIFYLYAQKVMKDEGLAR